MWSISLRPLRVLLIEIIQVALGKRTSLSRVPTKDEWLLLYEEAIKQSVAGVAFEGLQRLPQEQWPPQALLLQWIGLSEQTRARNAFLDERCKELLESLTSSGLHPTILKGQGVALYYCDVLRQYRQAGDIDVFVSDGRKKAIEYTRSIGQKEIDWDYKHLHLKLWNDTEVELHYHVEILQNVFKNNKLQKWFRENECLLYYKNNGLTTPTREMNMFYVLLHIYRHFFTEGVGLRQLMDYYFVLITSKGIRPLYTKGEGIEDVLKKFGMWRFVQGIMWIMQEVFLLDKEYMFCEPSENEGRFILDIVLEGGNFGHNKHKEIKGIGKLSTLISVAKHNMRIMRRYPAEALLSPVWYIWHKCWKMTR